MNSRSQPSGGGIKSHNAAQTGSQLRPGARPCSRKSMPAMLSSVATAANHGEETNTPATNVIRPPPRNTAPSRAGTAGGGVRGQRCHSKTPAPTSSSGKN